MNFKSKIALGALIIGSGVVIIDGNIVTLALPKIASDLNAGFAQLQWVVDGYMLTLASLILLGGSLGDILGRRRIYLVGLWGFGIFSLLCGISPSTEWLITFRILQGIFGALLIPGGLALINTDFPKEKRGRAIGLWSAGGAAFAAIGPLAGGYIIDALSWRWIFYINIPLIAACIVLVKLGVKESKPKTKRKVDFGGTILAALSLGAITYSLIEGPITKWQHSVLGILLGGIILAFIFIWYESKNKDPMMPLGLFKVRNFSGSNAMTFLLYGALSGFIFALVIYLQTKMHYSAIKSGASLLPVTIMLVFLSGRMGAIAAKRGPRLFMTLGPILVGVAILVLYNFKPGYSYFGFLIPAIFLFGLGMALTVAPLTSTVMSSASEDDSGIASAVNNDVTRIGALVVVALLGLLGADQVFKFSMVLCGSLAISAGLISYLTIQNPKKLVAKD
jgi:EmrB/QacA subfamily drug resistance transporter